VHHQQACCKAAGLEKALHGPAPGKRVGIDAYATLLGAPTDDPVCHRPADPLPADQGVNVEVLDRPHALAVRKLQQAASAVADDLAARASCSPSSSALPSPAQQSDYDQLFGSGELPAERAIGRPTTPVQADKGPAAPHDDELAHQVAVELHEAPDVAFEGKAGERYRCCG
jgi:hypothetical protein